MNTCHQFYGKPGVKVGEGGGLKMGGGTVPGPGVWGGRLFR